VINKTNYLITYNARNFLTICVATNFSRMTMHFGVNFSVRNNVNYFPQLLMDSNVADKKVRGQQEGLTLILLMWRIG